MLSELGVKVEIREVVLIIIAIVTVANTVILSLLKLGVSKFTTEMSELWAAINEIKEKQSDLRSELPRDYMRFKGAAYDNVLGGIGRIEHHLEELTRDCKEWREHNCPLRKENHNER